jgi:heptosyltransferase-3
MIVTPENILIVNTHLIGDVLLSTPLIQLISQQFQAASIDFLVNRGTGEFLEKDPRIRHVIYSDKWQKTSKGLESGYLLRLLRRYDLAITLNTADRGAVAVVVAGRFYRVGFYQQDKAVASWLRKLLYTHPLELCVDQHIVLANRQIATTLGIPCEWLEVKLFWDESDQRRVAELLASNGLPDAPYLVIHPFARWRYKYWETQRFAEVSDRLARLHQLRPIWTSSPDKKEIALLQEAAAGCSIKPLLLPGTLSLNQMGCLLKGAALYIGLDTAITHIAASTGVPMVALYGPTELWRWHPWDNDCSLKEPVKNGYRGTIRTKRIVTLQAACEHYPCIRPHCYSEVENPCMMALTEDDVCAEASRLLETTKMKRQNDHAV